MSTDLEQALARSGEGMELATPAEAIIARGDRMRRRRRRAVGAGAAGLLGLAGVFATTVLPADSGLTPPAVAGWSGPTTNLTPDELEAVTDTCIDIYQAESSWDGIPADAAPLAAEIRGDVARAFFREGDRLGTCALTRAGDGHFYDNGSGVTSLPRLKPGKHFAMLSVGSAHGVSGGPIFDIAGFLRVSADVDRVELELGDDTVTGTVSDGVALFWAEGEYSKDEFEDTEVEAFDAEGRLLDEGGLFGEPRVVTASVNDDAGR